MFQRLLLFLPQLRLSVSHLLLTGSGRRQLASAGRRSLYGWVVLLLVYSVLPWPDGWQGLVVMAVVSVAVVWAAWQQRRINELQLRLAQLEKAGRIIRPTRSRSSEHMNQRQLEDYFDKSQTRH